MYLSSPPFDYYYSYVIKLNTLFSYASLLRLSTNDFLLVIYFLF